MDEPEKHVALRFDEPEAIIYDCAGDDDKALLARHYEARAAELMRAGAVSVTVYHPSGFVAWYY